ncbi:MAG: BREX-1 system adenine-specific DNA-methyltransferase PglX [Ignavibacteriaceae bacterium]|jgi:hypothetical protein|nr:BREX-1 system adenine-specific DNA-methyltransferase PglX [Ignavibacteriaceae bacterium]
MNTNKIKTFAKKARIILLKGVQQRIAYWGIDKKGHLTEDVTPVAGGYMFRGNVFNDTTVPQKWQNLKLALARHTVDDIVEEAAYTWFNRLIAIKILSKNGYIDPVYEYVSDELKDPVILQKARKGDTGKLRDDEKKLLNQYLIESNDEEAFGLLLTAYCRNQKLLNRIFGHIDDYTELLLPNNLLSGDEIVELINDNDAIDEADYKEVELIGWLYQFYISDKKDEVFASFKKKKKARPEDIPAVTQIFTPKWIVKYMVENTVGRIWLDKHPDSPIRSEMKYFVEPSDKENYKPEPIIDDITQLTLLDPASGSGHILVVGFDLMMKMYKEEGYSTRNAVEGIIKNNLYGLDIDDRATQLANFAVLIKAASYYPDILKSDILPNVYSFPEAANFTQGEIYRFLDEDAKQYADELEWALKELNQGKNIGSALILNLKSDVIDVIKKHYKILKEKADKGELDFEEQTVNNKIIPFINILLTLSSKYHSVVTNPPYMGQKNMNDNLKSYLGVKYPVAKSDLFSVFMIVCCNDMLKNGCMGMINQHSWMFLGSYEKLRNYLIKNFHFDSMVHLGPKTFEEIAGEVVQSTAFIFSNRQLNKEGVFIRLIDQKDATEKKNNFGNSTLRFEYNQKKFLRIPGAPIAYWVSDKNLQNFSNKKLEDLNPPRQGIATCDNDRFLRYWPEISAKLLGLRIKSGVEAQNSKLKWFPYNKGGEFRKWYGNNYYVLNWENDGKELKDSDVAVLRNPDYYFKEGLTWSLTGSDKFGVRYKEFGFLFDVNGMSIFPKKSVIYWQLGFLNSRVCGEFLKIINPTISFQVGDIASLPIKIDESQSRIDKIQLKVEESVFLSKKYWDESETSWDFETNTLIKNSDSTISNSLSEWISEASKDFFQLHQNEEELNRIFIDIYGLQDELTSDVPLTEITILQDELDFKKLEKTQKNIAKLREEGLEKFIKKDVVIQQLLSYAIGCFMGRYRLDKPGLHIAHPNPTEEEVKAYKIKSPLHNGRKEVKFEIDEDGIIPMLGSYGRFSDDIVIRIKHFLETVWGEETLTENINFIQQCLDQDLEDYLVEDFWYYHCKVYQKKPIYWLFSSEYGYFQVLVYMHRMNKFTVQKIRNNYLLKHLQYLRSEIADLEKRSSSLSKSEAKELDELRSAEIECREYDKLMKDYADKQIEIDLDDGVKVNYAKFEDIVADI